MIRSLSPIDCTSMKQLFSRVIALFLPNGRFNEKKNLKKKYLIKFMNYDKLGETNLPKTFLYMYDYVKVYNSLLEFRKIRSSCLVIVILKLVLLY